MPGKISRKKEVMDSAVLVVAKELRPEDEGATDAGGCGDTVEVEEEEEEEEEGGDDDDDEEAEVFGTFCS